MPAIATVADVAIGYYCHAEGFSGPLYANSKCPAGSKSRHSLRPSECLRSQLDLGYDTRQARFSVRPTQLPWEHNLKYQTEPPQIPSPPLEVIPLIVSGPSTNRVNLMFFSDGCEFVYPLIMLFNFFSFREADVADERGKFIEDARRLAEDVSNNQTFNTVQPLLNFWAAFSPSKEVCFC